MAKEQFYTSDISGLALCRDNSIPIRQSKVIEQNDAFLLKPIVSDCMTSSAASFWAELSRTNPEVSLPSGMKMLKQEIYLAEKFDFERLPVSVEGDFYRFEKPFAEVKERLNSGAYCLLIYDTKAGNDFICINAYNTVIDDLEDQPTNENILFSYQTASIGDYLIDGISTAIAPFYGWSNTYWYYGAEYYLRPKNYDVSAALLEHSLLYDPPDLVFDEESELAKMIRKTDEYKEKLVEVAKRIINGKLKSDEPIGLNFTSGDLSKSILHADLHYEAIKTSDNTYTINVRITDDYDFDLQIGSNIFITIMNNKAFFDQYLGVIHPYKIEISIQEEINFEY